MVTVLRFGGPEDEAFPPNTFLVVEPLLSPTGEAVNVGTVVTRILSEPSLYVSPFERDGV